LYHVQCMCVNIILYYTSPKQKQKQKTTV